jgi:hypothetical protein
MLFIVNDKKVVKLIKVKTYKHTGSYQSKKMCFLLRCSEESYFAL